MKQGGVSTEQVSQRPLVSLFMIPQGVGCHCGAEEMEPELATWLQVSGGELLSL